MEHRATTRRAAALVGLLLLLGVGGAWTGHAQSLTAEAQHRLAPRLRAVTAGTATGPPLGALLSPVGPDARANESPRTPRYGVFIHTSDAEAVQEADVAAHRVEEGLLSARLTPVGLRTVAQLEDVEHVEPARTYEPLNDIVRAATGAHPLQEGALGRSYTGDGGLACVIDTGIDWSHPDFREATDTTSSRIRDLWDQTLAPRPGEQSPERFTYGVEYSRDDIERALGTASSRAVRSMDTRGHGTHVAATMAGNGTAGADRTHRGMAPGADIVAVKTDLSGIGIADGLRYCRSVAEQASRPVVATLSVGALGGPHDGSSPLARAVDAFTGPGRAVVAAAGNRGDRKHHVGRALPPGGTDSLAIRVPRYTARDGEGNDIAFRLHARLAGPEARMALVTPGGERVSLAADTAAAMPTSDGMVVYERAVPPGGDPHVEVLVSDASTAPPAAGTWSLVLSNPSSQAARLHGWLAETTTGSRFPRGDAQSTITVPATARSALTVGAWTHRSRWQTATGTNATLDDGRVGAVAPFSGRGPVRDRRKPDLVAPGQWTVSARSRAASPPARQALQGHKYTLLRGTSTASAAAAGAVALLLEEAPSLTPDRITELLTETAQPGPESSRAWTPRRGHGRLDVFGAMAALRGLPVATRTGPTAASSSPSDDRTSHTLGGGAQSLCRQFSPPRSGAVDGLLLHTAAGSANRLRDSLAVSIWTDENGTPGRPLGAPVRIAPSALANHTENFVSLAGADIHVKADTAYHVLLRATDGELDVAGTRRGGAQDRSWVRENGDWTPLSAGLELRVTTSLALDLDAPPLSEPASASIIEASETPTLTWEAVPEAEAYTVQVSTSPQFAPARTDTLRRAASSLRLSGLAPSASYYWRVRAERLGFSGPWSETRSFLYYPTTVDVRAAQTFSADDSPSEYRLVALPGRRPRPLAKTVEGRAGDAWTAYAERGRSAKRLVSFDGSSTFRFRPGNGFWLRSNPPWRVEGSVPSVPLRKDGTYTIALHDGWNIISNPFDLDVPWAAVEAANEGALPPPWRFGGQFERADTLSSARTGTAFYFLNDQGREALRLPYPAFPEAPSGAPSSKSAPSALTLTTARDGTPVSQVRVGVGDDATDGRDAYDQVAPPTRFDRTSLRLVSATESTPPRQRQLAAEYRSSTTDGHTFSLTLRAAPGDPVEVRADGLDVFSGQEVVLVDPAAGESHDLRASSTVTFRPERGPRSLRLLVGSSDYVETKQQVALPSDLQFLPNYPNPFRDQTALEYVLPEPASVRLAVYDVLGRQVRVLVDRRQKAGRHTVRWNGHDESGRRMASGVYLARLTVEGTTKVRKMTFVR